MNVNQLSNILYSVRKAEDKFKAQSKLAEIISNLQNLSSSPGDQNSQIKLRENLDSFAVLMEQLQSEFSPSDMRKISEISGRQFFSRELSNQVEAEIESNPMSPAAALQNVQALATEREEFIERAALVETGVDKLIDYDNYISDGEAAIGFEIPRKIFHNDFEGFIAELRVINRVVRAFSELETGKIQDIKLNSLSTTDPLIYLNTPPAVISSIALAVGWLLNQWKKVEEIRKLRAETKKTEIYSEKEIEEFFDKKIKTSLDKAIKDKSDELLSNSEINASRKNEVRSDLIWVMHALFARIERGMHVDVRVEFYNDDEDVDGVVEKNAPLQKVSESLIRN